MSISAASSNSLAERRGPQPVSRTREARESGTAVILTGLMLLFTIPAVGLAIDAGVLYVVRARLASACDAASLATARNLNLGITLAEQEVAAKARGAAFFTANFPDSYMSTSGTQKTITLAQLNASTITVTTSATTNAPLYFMRLLGGTVAVAGAMGKASRRDVNLMVVLDRSTSMAGTPCTDMKAAATNFVNMFANDRDTLGMVAFGTDVYLAYPPSDQFKNPGSANGLLTNRISALTCNGYTNASAGFATAYQQLLTINQPLALNLIVFFTDGEPTAFSAKFPVKTVADTRYGDGDTCAVNTTCSLPKSTCNDDNNRVSTHASWGVFAGKTGVLRVAPGAVSSTTGDTDGLYQTTTTTWSSGSDLIPSGQRTNCQFGSDQSRARRDLAYIPPTDLFENSTSGYENATGGNWTFQGSNPYVGRIRIDRPSVVTRVARNLADNAAKTARSNVNIPVTTFTIGLGSNGGVNHTLLRRMANDPDPLNTAYESSKPAGAYAYAPNSADLNEVFNRIASEILRLAQ